MSGFSHSLVDDISFLYSNISQKNTEVLNEDSQYYDEEVAELVEDIFSKICLSMIYEGYSANAVISFLANSSEDDILNEYLSFNENVIKESVISDEYIQEQLEILNEGIGSALKLLAKGVAPAFRLGKVALKRAMGPGARKGVKQAVTKVKDIATSVKNNAPKIAKGALLAGTGVLAGYTGAKLSGDSSAKVVAPKPVAPKAVAPKTSTPGNSSTPGNTSTPGNSSTQGNTSTPGNSQKEPSAKQTSPKSPTIGKTPGGTEYERRTPTSAELAAAQEKRATGGSEEEAIKAGVDAGKTSNPVKMDIPGFALGGKFDVDKTGIKPPTEFTKTTPEKKKTSTETTSEGYDAYDLVLEYLLSQGHTDTIEEAHYVMMEMDEETIGSIIEQYIIE